MSLKSLSSYRPRTDIAADLARLVVWPRQDVPDHLRLVAVDADKQVDMAFEIVTWPGALAFMGRKRGNFILSGRDFVDVFSRLKESEIPFLAKLAATPIAGMDFEWACYAIAWVIDEYRAAKMGSSRSAGGGPRGVKK